MKKIAHLYRIKSRVDWLIAFIFSFLILYVLVSRYKITINEYLLKITPDKISFVNQPEEQGVYVIILLGLLCLSLTTMKCKTVKTKYIATTFLVGGLLISVVIASYYYECRSILNMPTQCQPKRVNVTYFDKTRDSYSQFELSEEEKKEITNKVLALEPVSKKEQSTVGQFKEGYEITILYPDEKGHGYHV